MTIDDTFMPLADVDFVVAPHLCPLNVYLIPKHRLNLAFVGQLCDSSDYLLIFSSSFYCVQYLQSQKLIGTSCIENELYILDELKILVIVVVATTSIDLFSFHLSPSSSNFYLWHSRPHHVSSSLSHMLVRCSMAIFHSFA
jgi:hypothetical protein